MQRNYPLRYLVGIMKYLMVSLLLINISCEKEYSCEKCIGTDFKNATIIYTGEPMIDGCGWLIEIDSTLYHPDVLDSSFLQANLSVKIVFESLTDKFVCGKPQKEYNNIHLVNIIK